MFHSKEGKEVKVGDVLRVLSMDHTITHFEDHPGLTRDGTHYPARVACSGEWGCTLFDDDSWRLTSFGTWISAHSWFDFECKLGGQSRFL